MILLTATVEVHPTEDPQRIEAALTAIFPGMEFPDVSCDGEFIRGEVGDIKNFAKLLIKQRIRATARTIFLEGLEDDSLRFSLNKQVATVGKVNFQTEAEPLGSIEIVITSEDLQGLIDELAPPIKEVEEAGTSTENP